MAVVEWKGLGSQDKSIPGTWGHAISRLAKAGGDYMDVLEDIGKTSVTLTTKKLMDNKVMPRTSQSTLDQRRKGRKRRFKKRSISKGTTLVDTGVGMRQVSYKTGPDYVEVGVPDGYMAYHEEGRVPNAPRRKFLVMTTMDYNIQLVNFHWKKAMR